MPKPYFKRTVYATAEVAAEVSGLVVFAEAAGNGSYRRADLPAGKRA